MKRSSGFTLIELLVVISIIAILASLALPAITGALVRGQMTQTLSNMKQLHLATFNMDLDNQQASSGGGWPGTNGGPTTATLWATALTNGNYLSSADLQKMLSAQSVIVGASNVATPTSWALKVYAAGNTEDSGTIFLSSRNMIIAAASAVGNSNKLTPATTPFGNKGFVVFRRGGDGQIYQARFATNTISTTNQPAALDN
jgi:prepilin-type N-terminal cleavage/methylation domain-containing protein